MEEDFELPVHYNNDELHFPTRLLNYGYSYKLEVIIDGDPVLFEPDEERNWRAVLTEEDIFSNKKINAKLLEAIAVAMDSLLK
ncbi:MAG TPA: hypothetical protein VF487_17780 [Chitinophagaceae bacterium]